MSEEGAARADRVQRAREAFWDHYDPERDGGAILANSLDDALDTATRVRLDDDIIAAAREELRRQAFGWLDLRASRVIIAAAFRAAGFEVEE